MKMVISPVAHTNVSVVVSQAAAAPVKREAAESKPEPAAADTVQISSTGKALQAGLQAAVQEATETRDQTLKEATSGDPQAQRLLAKENAASEEAKESPAAKAQEAEGIEQVKA